MRISLLAPTSTGTAPWACNLAISAPGAADDKGKSLVEAAPATPFGSQAGVPEDASAVAVILTTSPGCRSIPVSDHDWAAETWKVSSSFGVDWAQTNDGAMSKRIHSLDMEEFLGTTCLIIF